jgi:hypothetical protein
VLGEPCDPGEHLQWREVQVGPLAQPRADDSVDFVISGHLPIIPVAEFDGEFAGPRIWQT